MQLKTGKILARAEDGVGWLTFNNPERRNAISLEMWQGLADAFAGFARDESVRAVVMRGAGGKAFVSGADISQFEDQRKNAEQAEAYARTADAGRSAMDGFAKPVVAMIEGYCIGGGVRIALAADIRVASDSAVFAITPAKLGLGYSYESITAVVSAIGPAAAKDLLLTGRRIDAAEALRIGLVTRVVAQTELEAEVRKLAAEIAGNAPLTIGAAKYAVDQAVRDPDARDLAGVDARIAACFASADYAEGRKAFMEKRKPRFSGR